MKFVDPEENSPYVVYRQPTDDIRKSAKLNY